MKLRIGHMLRSSLGNRAAGLVIRRLRKLTRTDHAARRKLLGRWVPQGALVFDLGANVGELTQVFVGLGAGVVAVEPLPECVAELHRRFAGGSPVHIVAAAVGAGAGTAMLHVGSISEVSTLSPAFREAYGDQAGVDWSETVEVTTTTLDALIAAHGLPAFAKLDLEGHEPAALAGLTTALPALSIEYNARLRPQALACIERLEVVAQSEKYRWNFSPYESYELALPHWLGAAEMRAWLSALPMATQTGDLYAELDRQRT
ncbi:MAG: FkbM family methyltransferase [Myxococcales bacterium]|nr:FkbM family methyltransferase [Myxococcales bacterium]